jgi:hypothetical protein
LLESEPQPASATAARRPATRPVLTGCCILMIGNLPLVYYLN